MNVQIDNSPAVLDKWVVGDADIFKEKIKQLMEVGLSEDEIRTHILRLCSDNVAVTMEAIQKAMKG